MAYGLMLHFYLHIKKQTVSKLLKNVKNFPLISSINTLEIIFSNPHLSYLNAVQRVNLNLFYRMWNIHGHCDCSRWFKFHLPLVWGSGFSHQHSEEVLHWTGSNSGTFYLLKKGHIREACLNYVGWFCRLQYRETLSSLDRSAWSSTVRRWSMNLNSATTSLWKMWWKEPRASTSGVGRRPTRRSASTLLGTVSI